MKYLVTGSDGFIGRNLVDFLLNKNKEVVSIDYPTDLCEVTPGHTGIDIVVHLAAETDVRQSLTMPRTTFLRNCQSTLSALEVARLNNARLIFASSAAAANPISPYGASKAAGEALCTAYRESYSMNITILRISNVYGPWSINKNSVVSKFIKNILSGDPVEIYGEGDQTRDFIYVKDVCKSIYNAKDNQVEICTGETVTINYIYSYLRSLAQDIGIDTNVTHLPSIKGEIKYPYMLEGLRKYLKIEVGLRKTFNWFSSNYKSDN